jgi:hypothetical protein
MAPMEPAISTMQMATKTALRRRIRYSTLEPESGVCLDSPGLALIFTFDWPRRQA